MDLKKQFNNITIRLCLRQSADDGWRTY